VFCPVCRGKEQTGFRATFPLIFEKIDELAANYPLDLTRLYATGPSMGGFR
jgi:predicted peptidase